MAAAGANRYAHAPRHSPHCRAKLPRCASQLSKGTSPVRGKGALGALQIRTADATNGSATGWRAATGRRPETTSAISLRASAVDLCAA
jgi:hypothetical protein